METNNTNINAIIKSYELTSDNIEDKIRHYAEKINTQIKTTNNFLAIENPEELKILSGFILALADVIEVRNFLKNKIK